jgi:hypothetical protein
MNQKILLKKKKKTRGYNQQPIGWKTQAAILLLYKRKGQQTYSTKKQTSRSTYKTPLQVKQNINLQTTFQESSQSKTKGPLAQQDAEKQLDKLLTKAQEPQKNNNN